MSVQDYAHRVDELLKGNARFRVESVDDAKLSIKRITQMQKELRQVKKEIGLTLKSLRAQYSDQKAGVGKPGFGQGFMQGIFGKKTVGRANAVKRDTIRQNQQNQLAPYEQLQHRIDNILVECDANKLKLEQYIAQQQ